MKKNKENVMYIYTTMFNSAIKNNEIMFICKKIEPEIIIVSKICQIQILNMKYNMQHLSSRVGARRGSAGAEVTGECEPLVMGARD